MRFLTLLWSKIKLNLSLDLDFLSFPNLPVAQRVLYILRKYIALTTASRQIHYLGINFIYDNHWTPALLQHYPRELHNLAIIVDPTQIHTLLDIGANIGQFAATWRFFNADTQIFSFEPNQHIYPILQKNVRQTKNWSTYPFAIGAAPGTIDFYFVANKSAQGSFYRANADLNLLTQEISKTEVQVIALDSTTIKRLGIPPAIDLIKIDTEGAEEQVLLGLTAFHWRYLYIECSSNRVGALSEERLWKLVSLGEKISPKLIFKSQQKADQATFDVIIENLAYEKKPMLNGHGLIAEGQTSHLSETINV